MKLRSTLNLLSATRSDRLRLSPQCRRTFHSPRVVASSPYREAFHTRQAHPSQRLIRLASSAAAAAKTSPEPSTLTTKSIPPAKSPTSNVPVPQIRAKLNPPDETYAPELSIPEKKSTQNYFKYIYQCGKLYIQFYKQGIRNVRTTSKLAKTLRQKRDKGGKESGEGLGVLTRAEWQVVHRSKRDVMRLPAFGALVLMFGEWLPLLALYITPLIPEPCRIPKQIQRKLRKAEARRKERERRIALDAARLVARDRKPGITSTGVVAPQAVQLEAIPSMDVYSLLSLSTKLDCHSGIWDKLYLTPPKSVLRWAVRRKLEYLKRDDGLIERDGGWLGLSGREVERACVERGVRVLGRKEEELRREMAAWFKR